ncbi:MAG TPA: stage III sporulation protein AF, partial [Bacillota bacterium]|nr:stage III sporulation protein AF [Bacillota bacterium]
MGDFLRNWIVNITVIIIFIMFLDTVMPNDSLKRYVKVIIGLLIIISVIKPFVLVKDYAKGFDREFLETINYVENNRSTVNSEKISKYQMQKAVEIFEGNLKNQIIKIVKRNIKPELKNVTVDLE